MDALTDVKNWLIHNNNINSYEKIEDIIFVKIIKKGYTSSTFPGCYLIRCNTDN